MMKQNKVILIFLLVSFAFDSFDAIPNQKYCIDDVKGASVTTKDGVYYVHDRDQYVYLEGSPPAQILLHMSSEIQSQMTGTISYRYYLELPSGASFYDLRLTKFGIDGQPMFSTTITTSIASTVSSAEAQDLFVEARNSVIALEQSPNSINFYGVNNTNNLKLAYTGFTKTDPTQKLQMISGNGQGATIDFHLLTHVQSTGQVHFYSFSDATKTSVFDLTIPFESVVFACQTGIVEIDLGFPNRGIKLYDTNQDSPGQVEIASGDPAPTLLTQSGININYQSVVISSNDALIIAMYDQKYLNSQFFVIYSVSNSPGYYTFGIRSYNPSDLTVLSYYTDYKSAFLQVVTTEQSVVSIDLIFRTSYLQLKALYGHYTTPNSELSGSDAQILTDLTLGGATNLKVSFCVYYSVSNLQVFSLFILKVGSTTSITRYVYSSDQAPNYIELESQDLQLDYSVFLSSEAQNLLDRKSNQLMIMTFQLECMCNVIVITQYICFGASLECTVAIQNKQAQCTVQRPGDPTTFENK